MHNGFANARVETICTVEVVTSLVGISNHAVAYLKKKLVNDLKSMHLVNNITATAILLGKVMMQKLRQFITGYHDILKRKSVSIAVIKRYLIGHLKPDTYMLIYENPFWFFAAVVI